ncbi:putative polysialic acid transport protein [Candidatus Symbiothrix dinenymphae]|nr:putative polysialic acid transport protein [Candidatus Symbiothrix dinenymphae]
MKRIVLTFLTALCFVTAGVAQMSDSQVLNYVKQEHAKGVSQTQIASDLMKRGVTRTQLERIQRAAGTAGAGTAGAGTAGAGTAGAGTAGAGTAGAGTAGAGTAGAGTDQSRTRILVDSEMGLLMSGILDIESDREQVFGRNIFNAQNLTFNPNVNIPTPVNYRLGPGDEVIIDIWGVSQTSLRQTISPDGRIMVERLGPLYLNGKTIQEANNYVQKKFAEIYAGVGDEGGDSQISLTLGQIRTIQIQVMGEVVRPGTYSVSSLASIFHALYVAGGVSEIGSLRAISLVRNGKTLRTLDVYNYLLKGKLNEDIRLTDNDVVQVPTYVSLVDIDGNVKRPMRYEMKDDETVADLLEYSGGFAGGAYADKVRLDRRTGGETQMFTISSEMFSTFKLTDKDLVSVSPGLAELYKNRVAISGAVYRAGYYELGDDIQTVKQLIEAADGVRGDVFLNRAILIRENDDLRKEGLAIDLNDLLNGTAQDILLRKNDALFVPSAIALYPQGGVTVHGAVALAGSTFEYVANMTLEDLLVRAGGLLESASTARIDIARRIVDPKSTTSTSVLAQNFSFGVKDGFVVDGKTDFILQPYDVVYVRQSPSYSAQQNVRLEGEVLFPGTYALNKKSERLSDIVKRAGDLTPEAYVKGARLMRKMTETEKFKARQIRMLAQGADSINLAAPDTTYAVGINLEAALKNPKSDYDVVLKESDVLIIPEFNSTVKISGAVMYPNTVGYGSTNKLSYYIEQAGGYTDHAKKGGGYIVYMNGTVSKARNAAKYIEPGCEIIIPTKVERQKLSTGEIISIGTSVASLATMVMVLINSLK